MSFQLSDLGAMLRSLGTFGERTVQRAQQAKRASAEVLLEETKACSIALGGVECTDAAGLARACTRRAPPASRPRPTAGRSAIRPASSRATARRCV